ncbi:MAG: TonB C-terminal domain-containing protein [Aliarcobacter sp.]|nr:TonB C-terminal domain-containing protein [Aliarcobacter sp.]
MQNNFSFILSGIIALSFYAFVCFLLFAYIASPIPKTYDLKSTSTTIELDMITEKAEKKMVEKKTEKIIEKEAVKEEKVASASNEKKPDLKSLFANVKETAKTVTKEEVNNVEKSIDPKRFKSKFEKEKRTNNIKIDKILEDEKTATNVKSTNANKGQETDEYFSQVQELLSAWVPVGSGLRAVVLIMIDLDGRFDYRVVTNSGDESFDSSLKAFLEEQKNVAYPKPTKDKDIKVNVDFRSEG